MTLFISDTDICRKRALKTAFVYLLFAVFCAIFGAVYELYSHEVYSYYMIYAFALPLGLGVLPYFSLGLFNVKKHPNTAARNLYNSGVATLTVGSIVQGILDIYGTTNCLTVIYPALGIPLLLAGLLIFGFERSSE